jgi:hypothetical protein
MEMAINRPEIFRRAMKWRLVNVGSCGRLLVLVVGVRRPVRAVGPTNVAVLVLMYRRAAERMVRAAWIR